MNLRVNTAKNIWVRVKEIPFSGMQESIVFDNAAMDSAGPLRCTFL